MCCDQENLHMGNYPQDFSKKKCVDSEITFCLHGCKVTAAQN